MANSASPGKRPRSSMSPIIVFDSDGKPVLAVGSPGGSRIICYVAKVLVEVLSWGGELDKAVGRGNLCNRGKASEIESGSSLVQMELAPAWIVAVILGRELGVTVLRSVAYGRGVTIPASPLGKVKMMSEVIAILLLILGREFLQQFFVLGQIALWVVLVTALISAVDYYRRFTRIGSEEGSAIE